MTTKKMKIRLKGHESFYIRDGWIRKGLKAIIDDVVALTSIDAVDILGVGTNMVKAIRYWLQAIGLTEEIKVSGSKRGQILTKGFGEIIFENDRFIEDKFSLALLHYKLCSNFELATSWYLFFNKVKINEFSKASLPMIMEQQLLNIDPTIEYSIKSLMDDCNCIIKTYSYDKEDLKNPEDNLICPFTELGLVKKVKNKKREEIIMKLVPAKDDIDKMAVLYVVIDQLKDSKSTTIEKLLEDECNVGRVFNIDKSLLNEYLDELEDDGYVKVNRTAGLNTIYIEGITKEEVLHKYYTK